MRIGNLSNVIPANVFCELPFVMDQFQINNPLRLAHFLAQCSHESANFQVVKENLNYSSEGLLKVFPKYFTKSTALLYSRNPEKIANYVYANRYGNGAEFTGDGWRYKGRGFIQLTFKANYTDFDRHVEEDIVNEPDLVCTKYALLSAGWFFHRNNILGLCDLGATTKVISMVTKVVNGGSHGLEKRVELFDKYYNLLK